MKTSDIAQMTQVEKLRVMEALWADLSAHESDIEFPAWHEGALKDAEARVADGKEQVLDWQDAKRMLRQRFE
jgi:hypothetical protein